MEWRFRIAPPGEVRRPLVPDVAYLGFDKIGPDAGDDAALPLTPPDVAVEVLSRGDKKKHILEKRRVYLAAGTSVILTVYPRREYVLVTDRSGDRIVGRDGVVEHPAMPGFRLDVDGLFRRARP